LADIQQTITMKFQTVIATALIAFIGRAVAAPSSPFEVAAPVIGKREAGEDIPHTWKREAGEDGPHVWKREAGEDGPHVWKREAGEDGPHVWKREAGEDVPHYWKAIN
jgi:hypothetical protein